MSLDSENCSQGVVLYHLSLMLDTAISAAPDRHTVGEDGEEKSSVHILLSALLAEHLLL